MFYLIQLRFSFLHSNNSYHAINNNTDITYTWQVYVFFFTPILLILLLIFRSWKKYNKKSLVNGKFCKDLKPTKENLIEAYISLAVILLNIERVDSKEKMYFIQKHLNRYFPGNTFDIYHKLSMYIKQRSIDTQSITDWINKNTESNFKKSNIIYFLVGIANADGEISQTELNFIKAVNLLLGLSTSDLESVLTTFDYYRIHKKQKEQSKRASSQNESSQMNQVDYSILLKENALKVLGLSNEVTIDEIKSAYRKLVKENHPDHFINENEGIQKIAHERFIKIQSAYEFLVKPN